MSQSETTRVERAANLFDLRRIIGGVMTVWGVLLIILGLTGSVAEKNKAAGININLVAGIGMLVVGLLFLLWAFSRPLGAELAEAEASDESGRGTRSDRERPEGSGDAGGE
jgi:xanthine/uracil/vitamin C permease (AzgA family)